MTTPFKMVTNGVYGFDGKGRRMDNVFICIEHMYTARM
jgi:hypothetical protein